jgi:hypothetical protein
VEAEEVGPELRWPLNYQQANSLSQHVTLITLLAECHTTCLPGNGKALLKGSALRWPFFIGAAVMLPGMLTRMARKLKTKHERMKLLAILYLSGAIALLFVWAFSYVP